jgi:virulence-associated protein VagC
MKIKQLSILYRRFLWWMERQEEPKCLPPIEVTKLGPQRIIKPLDRPIDEFIFLGPNSEQMAGEAYGEFFSDPNILEIEAEYDKNESSDTEEYRLPIREVGGFRIYFDD